MLKQYETIFTVYDENVVKVHEKLFLKASLFWKFTIAALISLFSNTSLFRLFRLNINFKKEIGLKRLHIV